MPPSAAAHGASLRRKLRCESLEERALLAIGPHLLKDLGTDLSSSPANIVQVGNLAFFTANDGIVGQGALEDRRHAEGTALVKDIEPGDGWSFPSDLTDVDGTLYFLLNNGSSLWKSDGSEAGTVLVKQLWNGIAPMLQT